MMLRAIGIYAIDTSSTTCRFSKSSHFAPKPQIFTLFNANPLESIEHHTLPMLTWSDLDMTGTLHFQHLSEHHYVRRISGNPFLMVICSKKKLDLTEVAYLMINIQHAFQHPDSSRVTLEDMIINPLGYIATDHLVASTQQDIEELKKVALSNINSLCERGGKLNELNTSVLVLNDLTSTFKRRTEEQNSWCSGSYCSI